MLSVLESGVLNDRADAGRSFSAMLAGKSVADWRQSQFCEYGNVQMVRDGRYKLVIWHGTGKHRLFDLVEDPREERDLANMPEQAYRLREMSDLLRGHYGRYSLPDRYGAGPGGPDSTNATSPWSISAG